MKIALSNGFAEINEKFDWLWDHETEYLGALYANGGRMNATTLINAEEIIAKFMVTKLNVDAKDLPVDGSGFRKLRPKDYDLILTECRKLREQNVLPDAEKKS